MKCRGSPKALELPDCKTRFFTLTASALIMTNANIVTAQPNDGQMSNYNTIEAYIKEQSMLIRQERPSDYDEVYNLVKAAFATVYANGTEPDEQDYLNELRQKDVFIPELSLVVENDSGMLIGQIVLYKTAIVTSHGNLTELLLSPISVHPDYFRRGTARAMVDEALRIAKDMGFRAVFLCGDPTIYKKLGFVPSYQYGIFHKSDNTAEWSMVRELYGGSLNGILGTIDTV